MKVAGAICHSDQGVLGSCTHTHEVMLQTSYVNPLLARLKEFGYFSLGLSSHITGCTNILVWHVA